MTKQQIEDESNIIQACKLIGASYKRDRIEFVSGLVAKVKVEPDTYSFDSIDGIAFSFSRKARGVLGIYKALVQFLYENENFN